MLQLYSVMCRRFFQNSILAVFGIQSTILGNLIFKWNGQEFRPTLDILICWLSTSLGLHPGGLSFWQLLIFLLLAQLFERAWYCFSVPFGFAPIPNSHCCLLLKFGCLFTFTLNLALGIALSGFLECLCLLILLWLTNLKLNVRNMSFFRIPKNF